MSARRAELPTAAPGMRQARKRFNTMLLDCRQLGSISLMTLVIIVSISLLAVFFGFRYYQLSGQYVTDTTQFTIEADQLRALLREQSESKRALQEQLSTLQEQGAQQAEKLSLAERELRAKQAQTQDLETGLRTTQELNEELAQELEALQSEISMLTAALKPSANGCLSSLSISMPSLRREAVKDAMRHAWDSYVKYAWGRDELKPVSGSAAGWLDLGLTVVDSLDTLWIMGMMDEFKMGQEWVRDHLSFDKPNDVSFFETVIRELGGLLSAYEFSKDKMFLDKAEDLAQRLLQSFNSEGGVIPYASVNLKTGAGRSPSWTGGASILSEIGTIQMEFLYLAYHTNKPEYAKKPLQVFKHLDSLRKDDGLYPLYVHPRTGEFQGNDVSLGALGDSFYEYMLKLWLLTDKQAHGYRRMFDESMNGVLNKLTFKTTPGGFTYIAQLSHGNVDHRLEHLACFSGGMLALGAWTEPNAPRAKEYMDTGAGVTETCHEAYNRTATGIGPEFIEIAAGQDFIVPARGKHYLLRPETVESFFYLWRLTHDQKYRDWGWEAFQAIEKHCRTDKGYSGIYDVNTPNPQKDDLQQSFFLAETLKYLYLLFSDDDVIPLDEFVFNTEAHPVRKITEPLDTWPQELKFELLLS